jgi:PAS domain S-box-containing protein
MVLKLQKTRITDRVNSMRLRTILLRLYYTFIFILTFGLSFTLNAEGTLNLSNNAHRSSVSDFVSIFPGEERLSIHNAIEKKFVPLPGSRSYGHRTHPVWSKIDIHNDTSSSSWYLKHIYALTTELSVYIPREDGRYREETLHIGDLVEERPVPERLMTFNIDIDPGEQKSIYIKHNTSSLVSYHFEIVSDAELIVDNRNQTLYQAFYYAFLLVIAIINVLLCYNTGSKRFLYISLFCVGMTLAYASYEGWLDIAAGAELAEYRLTVLIIAIGSAFISLINYIRYLAPSLQEIASLRAATMVLVVYWLILPVLSFFSSIVLYHLFVIGFMGSALFVLWPTYLGQRRGEIKSWHLLLSLVIFVVAYLLQGAYRLGLIDEFSGVNEGVRIGIVALSFSMTLSMMEYVKSLNTLIESSQVKFRNVFNNMQNAMAILDEQYRVIEGNRASLNYEGLTAEEFKGSPFLQISILSQKPDNTRKLELAFEKALRGIQTNTEMTAVVASGETHTFDMSIIPNICGINGKKQILVTGNDLTQSLQHIAKEAAISAVLSENTGDKFFEALAIKLSELTNQELTIIASVDIKTNEATTHAFYMDGEIQENFTYSLAGTPCDKVVSGETRAYHKDVAKLFPEDPFLAEAAISSYVGTFLRSSNGEPLGIIALLSRSPSKDNNLEEILNIFSMRASAEMERQRSLTNLLETQQKLSLHINQTPLGVVEVNNDNIVLEWNKAAEAIFGYTKEEILNQNASDTIFKGLSTQDFGLLLLNKREGGQNIFAHERKDQTRIYCEWFVTPLIDTNQELGYAAMFEDVTMQRKMLTALIRKEQEQSEILNSMADAAITIDENGKVLTYNQAAVRTFEYTEKEIVGKSFNLLMPESVIRHDDDFIKHHIATEDAQVLGIGREVEGLTKSGRVFPMRLMISELPPLESGTRRFIGTCHDQTVLKQKEQQLMRSQKMESLGKLTGGIAHDFNNILGIITGYTDLLTATAELDASEEAYIDEINRAANRGSTLTKKLLSLSKAKPMESTSVSLDSVIEGMKDVIVRTMTPRINVNFDLNSHSAVINVDLNSLEDTILNLCINAMHAMHDEGELLIRTQADVLTSNVQTNNKGGLYNVLSIRDTGEGIPKDILDQVFDPFFSTKGEKGTGLGLSQAYGFMKQSEGFIELESEIGVGTEFSLYFPKPLQENKERDIQSSLEDMSEFSGNEKILVVDDEQHLQKTTASLLEHAGYQVTSTGTPGEAISLVKNEDFDFVLSDVVMPEMNGNELVEELRALRPNINIQLMSGYLSDSVKQKVSHKGLKILVKPFSHRDLLHFVRTSIDETRNKN